MDTSAAYIRSRQRFSEVYDLAERLGVYLELQDFGTLIRISWIERAPTKPKGAGAEVVRAICKHADELDLRIELGACGGDPKLVAYYEAFGFQVDEDAIADDEDLGMSRPANAPDGVVRRQ